MNAILKQLNGKKSLSLWFILSAAAFMYGLYAFYYTYLDWTQPVLVGLNALLAGSGFGGMVFLCASAKGNCHIKKGIIAFIGGLAAFELFLWLILMLVNVNGQYNRRAIYVAYAVVTVLYTAGATLLFHRLSKLFFKPLFLGIAVICFPVLLITAIIPVKDEVKSVGVKIKSTQDISFESISADEVQISEEEKNVCEQWYQNSVLGVQSGLEPAYDVKIGKESLRSILRKNQAQITVSKAQQNKKGGETSEITIKPYAYDMEIQIEATLYRDAATCEWTVYITNTGKTDSEVISDFYPADFTTDRGEGEIYYSLGSHNSAEDFMLKKMKNTGLPVRFTSSEGRSTVDYLPYFNFSGNNGGFVLGIGWTGQWFMKTSASLQGTRVLVAQEKLNGYLISGETVRSPLVSISFYQGINPVKGFNTFRRFVTDCVYPEGVKAATMLETAGPMSLRTADEIIADLDTLDEEIYQQVDYFWMDAGWYHFTENWSDGVGNWIYDETRYDNGIKELADYGAQRGVGQVLWYEPERVLKDTVFYQKGMEHEGWLLDNGTDTWCFNLGNSDALAWFTDYLVNSMTENGVTYYRQDQNMNLDEYWEAGDKAEEKGRTGFCENHYISGEYAWLDALAQRIPGILIDNCASGGRRLDLEMARRSIPIWRSDYNCEEHPDLYEATQSQTLGLSCWLPLSGTLKYTGNRYQSLTTLIPCTVETLGTVHSEFFNAYRELRNNMCGNYYPVACGGYSDNRFLANEYTSVTGDKGFLVAYRRQGCESNTLQAVFSGLQPEATYQMYDYYAPDIIFTKTGEQLMQEGLTLTFTGSPDAILILFVKQ